MIAFATVLITILPMNDPIEYQEPLRPQFHFTAKRGWLNDPNGLCFYKGEYHLFFQHNPVSTAWGNMTWGHAVSKDLVHWQQVQDAIRPDSLGTIFSGSAVVDSHKTFPPIKGDEIPMVCLYTAAGGTSDVSKGQPFTQCLAFSTDGRTFTKYSGNPVIPFIVHENRDPKVLWYEPTQRWVMALYLDGDRFGLFDSPDLVHWEKTDEVEVAGSGECPDLFELPIAGRSRWVFWTADGSYRLGHFDGKRFTPETGVIRSHFGNAGYAAQTFFNEPHRRRVQISWLRGSDFPGLAWNQQMGFPTAMSLVSTPEGDRVSFAPVKEIETLWSGSIAPEVSAHGGVSLTSPTGLLDAQIDVAVPASGTLSIEVGALQMKYDAATHVLSGLGSETEIVPVNGRIDLRFLIDRAIIEIFALGGLRHIQLFSLLGVNTSLQVKSDVPGWHVGFVRAHALNSSWQ